MDLLRAMEGQLSPQAMTWMGEIPGIVTIRGTMKINEILYIFGKLILYRILKVMLFLEDVAV